MVMFTQGQMERMVATIELFRPKLSGSQVACIKDTGIELGSDFQVYPNPTKGELKIDFPTSIAETGILEIYNSTGQLVFRYRGILRNRMRVNLPILPVGVYWVKIGEKARKLVVS